MNRKIEGVCPIITTPFTSDGTVDFPSLEHVIRWLATNGCGAVTLFGIAGEFYKLTDDERRKMVGVTIQVCRETGCPSIISVTDHATEVAVERAREWEALGADCLMLLPPYFLKPGADALFHHMVQVARAVKIPVMLQYAPEQTGVTMTPELLVFILREVDNKIIYKIENRPPGRTISRMVELLDGKADIFVGNAGFQLLEGIDRGAIGVMPGCSMFDVYLRIMKLWQSGERASAIAVHCDLLALLNHIRQDVEQIIQFEKRNLVKRGILPQSHCRLPGFKSDTIYDRHFEELYPLVERNFIV